MKKKIFVANWKEHKNTREATSWLSQIANSKWQIENKEIIVCPSFALLPLVKAEIERLGLPVKLGSQDFPAFDDGPYTGEESPRLLKEFIEYAIIGHSERRQHFKETSEQLVRKVTLAKEFGIEPIFCVQDGESDIPQNVSIVAYEPVFAIGTGKPDTPENAVNVAENIKAKVTDSIVIYGGSVTEENVTSFLVSDVLSGVLIGSASLSPQSFFQIVTR